MPELKAAAGSGRQAGEQKEFMALNEYFRFEECIILGGPSTSSGSLGAQ